MMLIFPIIYPLYIKKEDVRDVVDAQRKIVGIILVLLAIVSGAMAYLVTPRLLSLYADLNISPPAYVQFSSYGILLLVTLVAISALYLLFSKPDYAKADAIASKYKNGEMIKTKELLDRKFSWLVLFSMIVVIAYLTITIYYPIRSLIQ